MCELCHHTPCLPGCPNYYPPKSLFTGKFCCECGEPILKNERYLENDNGEYAHIECADDVSWLLDWFEIEIMEDSEDSE